MKHEGVPPSQLMTAVMKAREAYARELFDIERVRQLMWKEADAGHELLHVAQDKPLRLQSTRAAMKLIAWLAREGHRIDWKEIVPKDGDPDVRQYAELRIYWSKSFDMISVPAEKWLADTGVVKTDDGSDKLPGSIG